MGNVVSVHGTGYLGSGWAFMLILMCTIFFFHVKNIKHNFSLAALLLVLQGCILNAFEWCSEEGLETSCRTASYSRGVPQLERENTSVRLRRSAASMTFEFPAPR